jgi:hypothetical protein
MYYYLESAGGNADAGYRPYPIADSYSYNNPLEVGKGYVPFIRDCESPTIIDVHGPINRGTIPLPVFFTFHNGPLGSGDGWNLIGNPYPSAINWNSPSWTKTNISPVVSIMDNGTGVMRYYDGAAGTFDGVIASGQAFWVRATAVSPVLIIQEGAKSNTQGHEFYRTASEQPSIPTISISLKRDGVEDIAFVKIREKSEVELDNWDATKLKNEIYGISTITPMGTSMAISAVPEIKEGYKMPLKLHDITDGSYTLGFTNQNGFQEYSIELTDKEEGIKKNLNWGETYTFNAGAEINNNRFEARLIQYQKSEIEVMELHAYPNPVKNILYVNLPPDSQPKMICVYDQRGVKIEDRREGPESQISEISFGSKPSGVYLIRLVGPGYNLLTKVIKE